LAEGPETNEVNLFNVKLATYFRNRWSLNQNDITKNRNGFKGKYCLVHVK
jgi:hypothetical protein